MNHKNDTNLICPTYWLKNWFKNFESSKIWIENETIDLSGLCILWSLYFSGGLFIDKLCILFLEILHQKYFSHYLYTFFEWSQEKDRSIVIFNILLHRVDGMWNYIFILHLHTHNFSENPVTFKKIILPLPLCLSRFI